VISQPKLGPRRVFKAASKNKKRTNLSHNKAQCNLHVRVVTMRDGPLNGATFLMFSPVIVSTAYRLTDVLLSVSDAQQALLTTSFVFSGVVLMC